jgi:hypothetical protein
VQLCADNWCLPNSRSGAASVGVTSAATGNSAGAGAGNIAVAAVEPWPPPLELAVEVLLLNKTICVHLDGPDKSPTVATVVVSVGWLTQPCRGHR